MSNPHFKANKALAFIKLVNSLLSSSSQEVQNILHLSPAMHLFHKLTSDRFKVRKTPHLAALSGDILLPNLSNL